MSRTRMAAIAALLAGAVATGAFITGATKAGSGMRTVQFSINAKDETIKYQNIFADQSIRQSVLIHNDSSMDIDSIQVTPSCHCMNPTISGPALHPGGTVDVECEIGGAEDLGEFKKCLSISYLHKGVEMKSQLISFSVDNFAPVMLSTNRVIFRTRQDVAKIVFARAGEVPWTDVGIFNDNKDMLIKANYSGPERASGSLTLEPNIQDNLNKKYYLAFVDSGALVFKLPIYVTQLYSSIEIEPRILYFGDISGSEVSTMRAVVNVADKRQRCTKVTADRSLITTSFQNLEDKTIVIASVRRMDIHGAIEGRLTLSFSGSDGGSYIIPYYVRD